MRSRRGKSTKRATQWTRLAVLALCLPALALPPLPGDLAYYCHASGEVLARCCCDLDLPASSEAPPDRSACCVEESLPAPDEPTRTPDDCDCCDLVLGEGTAPGRCPAPGQDAAVAAAEHHAAIPSRVTTSPSAAASLASVAPARGLRGPPDRPLHLLHSCYRC